MPIERTGFSGHCPDDLSKEIGVPREFQLEHPAGAPKDVGCASSILCYGIESATYGIDLAGFRPLEVYPCLALNLPYYSHMNTLENKVDAGVYGVVCMVFYA